MKEWCESPPNLPSSDVLQHLLFLSFAHLFLVARVHLTEQAKLPRPDGRLPGKLLDDVADLGGVGGLSNVDHALALLQQKLDVIHQLDQPWGGGGGGGEYNTVEHSRTQ